MLFSLDDDFALSYADKTPEWGPVGYITYKRTYARELEYCHERHRELGLSAGLKKSEEWWLTVCRVVEGTYSIQKRHCLDNCLPWFDDKAQRSAQRMYRLIYDFKFTPPGRGLQMMGTPVVDKLGGAPLNNCAFVSTRGIEEDFTGPFEFLMDMSMLGVGVGFDVLGGGLVEIKKPRRDYTHVVDDSREGWVAALKVLLESYQGKRRPVFDLSRLRPKGAPIRGFGGVSSGPEPLRLVLERVRTLLDARIGQTLSTGDITDIMNMLGVCVVSGNIRRSAEIALGSPTDVEFTSLKNYETYPEPNRLWRWASNNSVFATVGMDYSGIADAIGRNGEPGVIWMSNAKTFGRTGDWERQDTRAAGTNPCSEQTLEDRELCCLAELYPSRHENFDELEETIKYCYLYTKSVTLVRTHRPETNAVMLRNRRIGVSMTGIVQAMARHGRRTFLNWCDSGYEALRDRDNQYSDWLCVPRSIKVSSVKPSGTVSLLSGVTPGIHFPHSEYYWRVIRFATNSEYIPVLREAGYPMFDLAPDEPETTAVYFPVQEQYFDRGKSDVTMWEQLELAAQMQQYWCDNQVSITVSFKPEEAKDIVRALELYETRLKSVSFLPLEDHGYSHAPYQTITRELYESVVSSLKPIDIASLRGEVVDAFCDGDKCVVPVAK